MSKLEKILENNILLYGAYCFIIAITIVAIYIFINGGDAIPLLDTFY